MSPLQNCEPVTQPASPHVNLKKKKNSKSKNVNPPVRRLQTPNGKTKEKKKIKTKRQDKESERRKFERDLVAAHAVKLPKCDREKLRGESLKSCRYHAVTPPPHETHLTDPCDTHHVTFISL